MLRCKRCATMRACRLCHCRIQWTCSHSDPFTESSGVSPKVTHQALAGAGFEAAPTETVLDTAVVKLCLRLLHPRPDTLPQHTLGVEMPTAHPAPAARRINDEDADACDDAPPSPVRRLPPLCHELAHESRLQLRLRNRRRRCSLPAAFALATGPRRTATHGYGLPNPPSMQPAPPPVPPPLLPTCRPQPGLPPAANSRVPHDAAALCAVVQPRGSPKGPLPLAPTLRQATEGRYGRP